VAEGVQLPESNNGYSANRKQYPSPPESKSMACRESDVVNVGDPTRSRKEVSIDRQV
jgi:hypothetical protein